MSASHRELADRSSQKRASLSRAIQEPRYVRDLAPRLVDSGVVDNPDPNPTNVVRAAESAVLSIGRVVASLPALAATADGSELLESAAAQVPLDFRPFAFAAPHPAGSLYLERPIHNGRHLVDHLVWFVFPDGLTMLLFAFGQGRSTRTFWQVAPEITLADQANTVSRRADDTAGFETLKLVIAFNLLADQRVVASSQQNPSRAERRRAARSGHVAQPVVIVSLPRRDRGSHDRGSGSAVEYSHRWLVGGHWRRQWYPSVEAHKPIWIAPYVKGPEDKPLVVKEAKYVLDKRGG